MWYLCRRIHTTESGILWAETFESAQEFCNTLWGNAQHYITPFGYELGDGCNQMFLHPG